MQSPIFQSLPRIIDETNTSAELFENPVAALYERGDLISRRSQIAATIIFFANTAPSIPRVRQRALSLPRPVDYALHQRANSARDRARKS